MYSRKIHTKSEDGTAQSDDNLSILVQLGLGLELNRAHDEDNDPSHDEGDTEVEEGHPAPTTLIPIPGNRVCKNICSLILFIKRLINSADKQINSDK